MWSGRNPNPGSSGLTCAEQAASAVRRASRTPLGPVAPSCIPHPASQEEGARSRSGDPGPEPTVTLYLFTFESERVSRSVVFDSLQSHGLQPARLLCPWDSPGKNTGMGSHSLLQGIFPTQGSNPGLLHYRWSLNHMCYQGNPSKSKPDPKEYIQNMMPSPNAKH